MLHAHRVSFIRKIKQFEENMPKVIISVFTFDSKEKCYVFEERLKGSDLWVLEAPSCFKGLAESVPEKSACDIMAWLHTSLQYCLVHTNIYLW